MDTTSHVCSRRNFLGAAAAAALTSNHLPLAASPTAELHGRNHPESLHSFAKTAPVHPAFFPLQAGAVTPRGWLLDWATSAANGITGHLDEYCATFSHAWKGFYFEARGINPDGTGWPIEQCSYWLDGAIRLGYQIQDNKLLDKVQDRLNLVVNGVLKGGTSFIYWRPRSVLKDGFNNWAHSHMGRALVAYYQASRDPRVLDALVAAYRNFPLPDLVEDFSKVSGAVNIDPMLDTYVMSGDRGVLKTVQKFIQSGAYQTTRSDYLAGRIPPGHAVVFYESIRVPALLYSWSGDNRNLEATLKVLQYSDLHYGLPVGVGSGEEWQAGIGSTRNIETCDVIAAIWTFLCLSRVTGDASYSDRVEEIFFNAGPEPVGRDFKILSYYQCMNRYGVDLPLEEPRKPTGRDRYKFTKIGHPVLCCVGNINRLIPNYTMHMWMATPDAGLAAVLYGPSLLRTGVRGGMPIEIESRTAYPFEESIDLHITPQTPVQFPLYLRIPGWCSNPEITVNGKRLLGQPGSNGFLRVQRRWTKGDRVELHLPMPVRLLTGRETSYPQIKYFENSRSIAKLQRIDNPYASIYYGPLLFSFPIRDENPNQEIPGQNFHYALDVRSKTPRPSEASVHRRPMPARWDWPLESPLELQVRAEEFDWHPTDLQPIPKEPVGEGESAKVVLVPYGCTKFRVTMFPVTKEMWEGTANDQQ